MTEVVADHPHYWFSMKFPPTASVLAFNWSAFSCLIHWIFCLVVAVVDREIFLLSHQRSKSQRYHFFEVPNLNVSVVSTLQVSTLPLFRRLKSIASRQLLHRRSTSFSFSLSMLQISMLALSITSLSAIESWNTYALEPFIWMLS